MTLLMEDRPLLDRIAALSDAYKRSTGKFPTRLVLTADDLWELNVWLQQVNYDHPAYASVRITNQAEILGMLYNYDAHAKVTRVYFQES
jgi:hypothetical protein